MTSGAYCIAEDWAMGYYGGCEIIGCGTISYEIGGGTIGCDIGGAIIGWLIWGVGSGVYEGTLWRGTWLVWGGMLLG